MHRLQTTNALISTKIRTFEHEPLTSSWLFAQKECSLSNSISDVLPKVLPAGWTPISTDALPLPPEITRAFAFRDGLRVIATIEDHYPDGSVWLHVSFSYGNRLPNWQDLRAVKDLFIGKNRLAVQILPVEEDYVNRHPFTLHLYTRINGDTLPGLAPGGRTLT
jgi:hypothetical protein